MSDAKLTNLQIIPNDNKVVYINQAHSLLEYTYGENGRNWRIPDSLIPKDYARVVANEHLIPQEYTFGVNSNGRTSTNHVFYNDRTYYLNVGGVYRFTTPRNHAIPDKFFNTVKGHEIVKYLNEEDVIYTISPKLFSNARKITFGEVYMQICTAFVHKTQNGFKVTGKYDTLSKVVDIITNESYDITNGYVYTALSTGTVAVMENNVIISQPLVL